MTVYIHEVLLEELLQLSLSGRVREVSDVQSPSLSRAGDDSLVLRSVDWLVAASSNTSALGGVGGLVEVGVCHLAGDSVDGHVVGRLGLMTRR